MSFTVGWYETGMLVDCTGYLGQGATEELLKTVGAALDALTHPTPVILDWRGMQGDPYHLHQCTKRVVALQHPHLDKVAAVGRIPIVRMWIDLMAEELDYPYLACTSIEDAVQRLRPMEV